MASERLHLRLGIFNDHLSKDDLFSNIIINIANSAVERRLGLLDTYTLSEYLRCSGVDSAALITALVMIEKFRRLSPKPRLYHEITATELLIVATMAASKFLHDTDSDESMCNQTWALNFNYNVEDLNNLEVKLYSSLGWNLFVSKAEFENFITSNFPVHPNDPGDHRALRHSHIATKRIPDIRMNRKMVITHFKWPLTKAMTVVAAAFLALSHSGLSPFHDDRIRFQMSKSLPVNTTSVLSLLYLPNQSCPDVSNFPSAILRPLLNRSTSPLFEHSLYENHTPQVMQNPVHNLTLLKAGVS